MPYAMGLPLSGSTPLSRHTSALGAKDAAPRACAQTRRYFALLAARGEDGATDWEAAALLGWERSTVNARRGPWVKGDDPWIVTRSTRPGPTGIKNAVWIFSDTGKRAIDAMREAA